MKPYNANELLFFENIIKNLSKTEANLVTIRGDVNQNIGYLESDAINEENVCSKKRVKENNRKSLKRKHQRNTKKLLHSLA